MNPSITKLVENDDIQTFTLSGVNVSLANAIRRTILSDINAIIFKTTPYEENKATIYENTSRLNNEIIKQRLSCIPIHIPLLDEKVSNITDGLTLAQLEDYVVEVNVSNETDSVIYITTKDFKIKKKILEKYFHLTKLPEIISILFAFVLKFQRKFTEKNLICRVYFRLQMQNKMECLTLYQLALMEIP